MATKCQQSAICILPSDEEATIPPPTGRNTEKE